MNTLQLKDFDRKIADIDKKLSQAQKRVNVLREEKKAVEIAKESFFGKKADKNKKKDDARSAVFDILDHGNKMHYKEIAKEAREKFDIIKSDGAFYTMLDRMSKEDDMICPLVTAGKGEFILAVTNSEMQSEDAATERKHLDALAEMPF